MHGYARIEQFSILTILFLTIHTNHNHELNQGVAPPGLTHLTYHWRERASGNVTRNTSEANRICTRVYVLISATKKGRLVCKSSCHGCPALHRRTGPVIPRDYHSLAEAIVFALISPLIILQSSNQSLYSMFALQHGVSSETTRQAMCMLHTKQQEPVGLYLVQ